MALALVTLFVPATARAVEVDCMNAFGSCTLSNDGFDQSSCDCGGGGVTTGAGGNDWAGLDEAELLVICFDHLDICDELGTSSGGSFIGPETTSVGVTTAVTETDSGTTDESESATTSPTTETGSSTDHSTSSPSTTDPSTTSGPDLTGSTTDDESTSGSTSDGTSTGDGTTGTASLSTTGETAPPDDDDGSESSGGADTGGGGCGCTTDGDASPFAALGLFALLGLRRRRR